MAALLHDAHVSIRARHCWRANRGLALRLFGARDVSIRARHCWRANLPDWLAVYWDKEFQSAPAIAGGRIPTTAVPRLRIVGFQSAPAIAGGRIRSPDDERSQPAGFNPRPPLLAGESIHANDDRGLCVVSIRARHCWRANPPSPWLPASPPPGFNPRPPLLAGESPPPVSMLRTRQFQSAPAIAGGRIPITKTAQVRMCGFNPRPPLLAGESGAGPKRPPPAVWFQSAPAIAGGRIPQVLIGHDWALDVSIRARHCWRANRSLHAVPTLLRGFNPRPPLLAGESRMGVLANDVNEMFQSAPAIAGGRIRITTAR